MDCSQLRQLVQAGGATTSPEAAAHLADCAACRSLVADDGRLASFLASTEWPAEASPAVPSLPDLERLLTQERQGSARLKSLPSRTRWLLAGLMLLLPIGLGLGRLRPDIATFPVARLGLELAALLGLTLATCWLWLRPLQRIEVRDTVMLGTLAAALVVPWLLAALPLLYSDILPSSAGFSVELHRAVACFLLGSAQALPVAVVVTALGRGGRRAPGFAILPAATGALAGLVGLELHCPYAEPVHLLTGHAPIVLAFSLVGIAFALRRRRTPLAS